MEKYKRGISITEMRWLVRLIEIGLVAPTGVDRAAVAENMDRLEEQARDYIRRGEAMIHDLDTLKGVCHIER